MRGSGKTGLHDVAERSAGQLRIERVDIADFSQIIELRKRIANCQFNLLFVNAGIANGPEETISAVTTEEFVRVMVTNALGPMRVVETLGDLVRPDGTIGVMSSRLGSVATRFSSSRHTGPQASTQRPQPVHSSSITTGSHLAFKNDSLASPRLQRDSARHRSILDQRGGSHSD